jgi:hypothetical protein
MKVSSAQPQRAGQRALVATSSQLFLRDFRVAEARLGGSWPILVARKLMVSPPCLDASSSFEREQWVRGVPIRRAGHTSQPGNACAASRRVMS